MDKSLYKTINTEYNISPLPEDIVVAMAYVPYQNPKSIYTAEDGFSAGTLFPCLDKPFLGCGGNNQ